MSAMNAQYFAALSISSLASDDRSVSIDGEGSYISNSAIYQQLSNIEDITANFIIRKPTVLDFKHGVYSEIEYENHQDFEFQLSSLSQHELISICVKCLPNFTVGEPLSVNPEQDMKVGENHCALIFNLERRIANKPVGENIPFKATLTNGEYTIVLSSSAKVLPGTYLLSVGLADVGYYSTLPSKVCADIHAVQAVRVQLSRTKTVRTVPLETGVTVSGSASFRDMCYYRFVAGDPRHMITIRATATAGSSGDADLYVSNRFQGQVAVTRDNYVWSSLNSGVSRIDILPDDANLPVDVKEGRIFVIGVASSGEETDFELTVTTTPPPPYTVFNFAPSAEPHSMAPPVRLSNSNSSSSANSGRTVINCAERGCTLDLALVEGEHLHFAVKLPDADLQDPRIAGSSIVVLVHDTPGLASIAHATVVQQVGVPALLQAEGVVQHRGLGVHTGDSLAAQGLLPTSTSTTSNGNGYNGGSSSSHAQHWSDHGSGAKSSELWPVVYASADVLFPDSECYTWRASSAQGKAVMLLNPAEWKYTRPVCYFSIHGHSLCADKNDAAEVSTEGGRRKKAVRLSLWRVDAQPALPKAQQLAQEVVSYIYEKVDAQTLSLADRKYDSASHAVSPHLRAQDDHNVTYFEIDYAAMVQLLHASGAANGQVFYDLGCGSGRALLSAALSGIRFVKCVGVEVLPSLASAAQQAVNALTRSHDTSTGDVFRTPRSATATPTPGQTQPGTASKPLQDQRVRSRLDLLNIPLPAMEIWLDNVLAADWSDADYVYAASLCFSDSLVHQMVAHGARLRVGARLVTLKLTENYHQWFALEKTVHVIFSFGSVPAYVLLRVASQS